MYGCCMLSLFFGTKILLGHLEFRSTIYSVAQAATHNYNWIGDPLNTIQDHN